MPITRTVTTYSDDEIADDAYYKYCTVRDNRERWIAEAEAEGDHKKARELKYDYHYQPSKYAFLHLAHTRYSVDAQLQKATDAKNERLDFEQKRSLVFAARVLADFAIKYPERLSAFVAEFYKVYHRHNDAAYADAEVPAAGSVVAEVGS